MSAARKSATLALALAAALLLASAAPALAEFMAPTDAPVERLIKNVTAYTKEHPEDADGFYTLARLHSLAFCLRTKQIGVYGPDKPLPTVDHQFQAGPERTGSFKAGEAPSAEELKAHLAEALANFKKAIGMKPGQARYHLGLAFTLEAGGAVAEDLPPGAKPPETPSEAETAKLEALARKLGSEDFKARETAEAALRSEGARALPVLRAHLADKDQEVCTRIHKLIGALWAEVAIPEYLNAHELAIKEDGKLRRRPTAGVEHLVSHEAGRAYLRLVKARGVAETEKDTVGRVEKAVKGLDALPMGAITPIILPLDRARPMAELLAPGATVNFDINGDGRAERIPWVRPETGILVWDPEGTGRVTSGRQLFGSVTWWMFWADGYRALDALDDDRDGALSGDELRGLAVWRDRNSNGVCDPGEVVPVASLGIKSLAVRATSREGDCPANPRGVRFSDGREWPSYDWLVEPGAASVPGRQ